MKKTNWRLQESSGKNKCFVDGSLRNKLKERINEKNCDIFEGAKNTQSSFLFIM